MEGYSYTNIFATKGIEYLVIIAFLTLLIPFWVILNKQSKITKQIQKVLGNLTANILRIPQGLYFSQNHTWAHLQESGIAKVGIDDLLLHLTGNIKFNNLRNSGEIIKKGDLLTEIDRNGKILRIFSPISGKIIQSNSMLSECQDMFHDDLYSKCWVYKIKPSQWVAETSSYYLAEEATDWSAKELERFKDFMAVTTKKYSADTSNIILQDGGELCDNTLAELPNEVWQDFQKDFLNQTL